jgi:hypothetical protein
MAAKFIQPLYKIPLVQKNNLEDPFIKLYDKIKSSDYENVKLLLESSDIIFYNENNSLCFAIIENDIPIEIFKEYQRIELLENIHKKSQNSFSVVNSKRQSLLHVACIKNYRDIIKYLLDKDKIKNIKNAEDIYKKKSINYFIESNTYECDENNDFFNKRNAVIKNTKPIEIDEKTKIEEMLKLINFCNDGSITNEFKTYIENLVKNKKHFDPSKFIDIIEKTKDELYNIKISQKEDDIKANELILYTNALKNFKNLYNDFLLNEILDDDGIESKINEHYKKIDDSREKSFKKLLDHTDILTGLEDIKIQFFNVPVANYFIFETIEKTMNTTFIDWLKDTQNLDCLFLYTECIEGLKTGVNEKFIGYDDYNDYNNEYKKLLTDGTIKTIGEKKLYGLNKIIVEETDAELNYFKDDIEESKKKNEEIENFTNEVLNLLETNDYHNLLILMLILLFKIYSEGIVKHYVSKNYAEINFKNIKTAIIRKINSQTGGFMIDNYVLTKKNQYGGDIHAKNKFISYLNNLSLDKFDSIKNIENSVEYYIGIPNIADISFEDSLKYTSLLDKFKDYFNMVDVKYISFKNFLNPELITFYLKYYTEYDNNIKKLMQTINNLKYNITDLELIFDCLFIYLKNTNINIDYDKKYRDELLEVNAGSIEEIIKNNILNDTFKIYIGTYKYNDELINYYFNNYMPDKNIIKIINEQYNVNIETQIHDDLPLSVDLITFRDFLDPKYILHYLNYYYKDDKNLLKNTLFNLQYDIYDLQYIFDCFIHIVKYQHPNHELVYNYKQKLNEISIYNLNVFIKDNKLKEYLNHPNKTKDELMLISDIDNQPISGKTITQIINKQINKNVKHQFDEEKNKKNKFINKMTFESLLRSDTIKNISINRHIFDEKIQNLIKVILKIKYNIDDLSYIFACLFYYLNIFDMYNKKPLHEVADNITEIINNYILNDNFKKFINDYEKSETIISQMNKKIINIIDTDNKETQTIKEQMKELDEYIFKGYIYSISFDELLQKRKNNTNEEKIKYTPKSPEQLKETIKYFINKKYLNRYKFLKNYDYNSVSDFVSSLFHTFLKKYKNENEERKNFEIKYNKEFTKYVSDNIIFYGDMKNVSIDEFLKNKKDYLNKYYKNYDILLNYDLINSMNNNALNLNSLVVELLNDNLLFTNNYYNSNINEVINNKNNNKQLYNTNYFNLHKISEKNITQYLNIFETFNKNNTLNAINNYKISMLISDIKNYDIYLNDDNINLMKMMINQETNLDYLNFYVIKNSLLYESSYESKKNMADLIYNSANYDYYINKEYLKDNTLDINTIRGTYLSIGYDFLSSNESNNVLNCIISNYILNMKKNNIVLIKRYIKNNTTMFNDLMKQKISFSDFKNKIYEETIEYEKIIDEENKKINEDTKTQSGGSDINIKLYNAYYFNNIVIKAIKKNISTPSELNLDKFNKIIEGANNYYYSYNNERRPKDYYYYKPKSLNLSDETNINTLKNFLHIDYDLIPLEAVSESKNDETPSKTEITITINNDQYDDGFLRKFEDYEMYFKDRIPNGYKILLEYLKNSSSYKYIYNKIQYDVMIELIDLESDVIHYKPYTEQITKFKDERAHIKTQLEELSDETYKIKYYNYSKLKIEDDYIISINPSELKLDKVNFDSNLIDKDVVLSNTQFKYLNINVIIDYIYTDIITKTKDIEDYKTKECDFNIYKCIELLDLYLNALNNLKLLQKIINETKKIYSTKENKLFTTDYQWLDKYKSLKDIHEKINTNIVSKYMTMDDLIFNKMYEKIKNKIDNINSIVKENNKMMSWNILHNYSKETLDKNDDESKVDTTKDDKSKHYFINDFIFINEKQFPAKFRDYAENLNKDDIDIANEMKKYLPYIDSCNYNEIKIVDDKTEFNDFLFDNFSSGYASINYNPTNSKEPDKNCKDILDKKDINNTDKVKYVIDTIDDKNYIKNYFNTIPFINLFINIEFNKHLNKMKDLDLYTNDDILKNEINVKFKTELFKQYTNILINEQIHNESIKITNTMFNNKIETNNTLYKEMYEKIKNTTIHVNDNIFKDNVTNNKITTNKCFNKNNFSDIFGLFELENIPFDIYKDIINLKNYKMMKDIVDISPPKDNDKELIKQKLDDLLETEVYIYKDVNLIINNISIGIVKSVNETSSINKLETSYCEFIIRKMICEFNDFILESINCFYQLPKKSTYYNENFDMNEYVNKSIEEYNKFDFCKNTEKMQHNLNLNESDEKNLKINNCQNDFMFDKITKHEDYKFFELIEQQVYEDYNDLDKYENIDYNTTQQGIINVFKNTIDIFKDDLLKDIKNILKKSELFNEVKTPINLDKIIIKFLYNSVVNELNINYPDKIYDESNNDILNALYSFIPVEEIQSKRNIELLCDFYSISCKKICSEMYRFFNEYLESLHNIYIYLRMKEIINTHVKPETIDEKRDEIFSDYPDY